MSTVERWPGVRVDRGSSAHVLIRHSGIPEELDLAAHGLRYLDCDPWAFAPAPRPGDPGPDGRPLVFSVDLNATCDSIAAACGEADAAAYRRFVAVWGARSRIVAGTFGIRPSPGRLVRSLWPLGHRRQGARGRLVPSSRPSSSARATRSSTAGSPGNASRPRWPGSAPSPGRPCPNQGPRRWWAGRP